MKTSDFYYDLPQELIAQTPLERRDTSRLMVLDPVTQRIEHRHFYDLTEYLNPGDTLVMNDSRVLPAHLLGKRIPTGGAVEVLLLTDRGNLRFADGYVLRSEYLRSGLAYRSTFETRCSDG